MGVLHYADRSFAFDDRLLSHLQVVLGLKLRRGENFMLSWKADHETGEGRHAVWIDNGVPIHFEYSGSRLPAISREWIESLATASNSSGGLNLSDEHAAAPQAH